MKRYSRVSPPDFLTSSPAAAADPPVAIKSLARVWSAPAYMYTYIYVYIFQVDKK